MSTCRLARHSPGQVNSGVMSRVHTVMMLARYSAKTCAQGTGQRSEAVNRDRPGSRLLPALPSTPSR